MLNARNGTVNAEAQRGSICKAAKDVWDDRAVAARSWDRSSGTGTRALLRRSNASPKAWEDDEGQSRLEAASSSSGIGRCSVTNRIATPLVTDLHRPASHQKPELDFTRRSRLRLQELHRAEPPRLTGSFTACPYVVNRRVKGSGLRS